MKQFYFNKQSSDGFGMIEIIIVSAIITLVFFGVMQTGILSLKLLRGEKENLEAVLLAEEALEATRSLRDQSWNSNISWRTIEVPYYPLFQNGAWILATTSSGLISGKYNQYVKFSQVYRDVSDKIAGAGTLDTQTLKVIAYATTTSRSLTLTTYITDFPSKLAHADEEKSVYYEDAFTDLDLAQFPDPANAGNGDPAQSFTISTASIRVTKVELPMRKATTTPSNIFLEIRESPTGTVLGTSQTIISSTASTSVLWIPFYFWDMPTLAANTVYYLRLRSIPSSNDTGSGTKGPIHWQYKQSAQSPYAGGEARRYIGRLSNPQDVGQVLSQYDFGFRVYARK